MQQMSHQMMGYDRAITMFSPDGRLLQVEYAKKTVKQGSTAIGIVCKDGILLVTDKRIVDKLVVTENVEKIWEVDDHIAATASGILSDARVLMERAQLKAQQHKVTYDTPIDIISVVKEICDLKQICTQSAGLRPFGVSLLIAGINRNEPVLYETDPTGIYFPYKATAIGEGETDAEEFLHKNYKSDITIGEALILALKALTKVLGDDFSVNRVDAVSITIKEKAFNRIERSVIEKALRESKKK